MDLRRFLTYLSFDDSLAIISGSRITVRVLVGAGFSSNDMIIFAVRSPISRDL